MEKGVILVKGQAEAIKKLLFKLRRIKGISDAYAVAGRFDAVVFIEGRSFESLSAIAKRVNGMTEIKSSETLLEVH